MTLHRPSPLRAAVEALTLPRHERTVERWRKAERDAAKVRMYVVTTKVEADDLLVAVSVEANGPPITNVTIAVEAGAQVERRLVDRVDGWAGIIRFPMPVPRPGEWRLPPVVWWWSLEWTDCEGLRWLLEPQQPPRPVEA